MALYAIAVLGNPSTALAEELRFRIESMVKPFGLAFGTDITWEVKPERFRPDQGISAAVGFVGAEGVQEGDLPAILRREIPVLPIYSAQSRFSAEIPRCIRHLNGLAYEDAGVERIASTLLEAVGLLPRQRRVFLSYRRAEAREAALQLFDVLSGRLWDVFLDTHDVAAASDFQSALWQRLCDSDVLVMLDTKTYFESRWTDAEFGRALAKGIAVLRVAWPNVTHSRRAATAAAVVELKDSDIDSGSLTLSDPAVESVAKHLEAVRSESHAVRSLNMFSRLSQAVERIGGKVLGVGVPRVAYIELSDGTRVAAYPTVNVPTSVSLHEAAKNCPYETPAVVYDEVGLHRDWVQHLDWLGTNIQCVRFVKLNEAAWQFADWKGLSS